MPILPTRCLSSIWSRWARSAAGVLPIALAIAVLVSAPLSSARADDYLDRVNKLFASIPENKRSDLVILPLLAKMTPPPAELRSAEFAALVDSNHPAWSTIEGWATAPAQKDLLQAMRDVTQIEDFRTAMVFAQGYGVEAVANNPDLLGAEMYTELGDPPTLAAARHMYLPAIGRLIDLANVEATRLLAAGDPKAAIDVLFDALYFYRQFADRPFLQEKHMGLTGMRMAMHRIRDIAYQDSRSDRKAITAEHIKGWIGRLDSEKGYVSVNRLRLPEGNLVSAEQLVSRVMIKDSTIDRSTFSPTLARISGGNKPLRVLSEASYWDRIANAHSGYFDTMDQLIGKKGDGGIRADWNRLWSLDPFDPLLRKESTVAKRIQQSDRYAVLKLALGDVASLFPKRMTIRAEIAGTRVALGVYGYFIQTNGSWPPHVTAIRPAFMPVVDLDPYNTKKTPFSYFVPVRDRPAQGSRGEEVPFELRVWPGVGRQNFALKLRADQFMLYSVGPNDADDLGTDATQDDPSAEGDYLMWPPIYSLLRKNLSDTGQQP